jgi:RimJ/RimL family protein N-acetyltransferase
MRAEIARRLEVQATGDMLAFATRRNDTGALCGMTTYMHIDAANRRLEIGSTWTAASVQRSGVNTECKLMLLTHAFETLDCIAVEFRTNFMNHQSRAAIARLGARQDGILRSHQLMEGGALRDTVVFSIIASEWPTTKRHLQYKLNR